MRGIRAEQHEHLAEDPVVQRHREHRQEADAQAGEARPLPEIKRGETGAAEQHSGGRRDDRLHADASASNSAPKKAGSEIPVVLAGRPMIGSDSGDEQYIGRRIGEAARRPFGVMTKLVPNNSPTGIAMKTMISASDQSPGRNRRNRP